MKDRRYHIVPPWLVLPLVALTVMVGLWLSVRNTESLHEAVPDEAPVALKSGETGPADASSKNDGMGRWTGHAKAQTTTEVATGRKASVPAPLPPRGANHAPRVQRLPPRSANVQVGLDQVSTQGPRLESASLPHWDPGSNPPLERESVELQPPSNRDLTETRLETGPPEVSPDNLTIESELPELLELPDTGRSWDTELTAREADSHTRVGFDLAGRGAIFSARAEFIVALRLIAQARDEDRRNTDCSRALAVGVSALEEAEDFLILEAGIGADLDLPDIIRGHHTPVLRDAVLDDLTSHAALRCYLSFAKQQLAASAGSEVAGSMALCGLGKLHGSVGGRRVTGIRASLPKSVVFHQAALLVMPRNHLALNDLGVLLARGGRHEDARGMMEHGLAIHPSSVGWRNLGLVLWQLGQTGASRQAHQHYQACLEDERQNVRHRSDSSGQPVRWVDPDSFAKLGDRLRNVKLQQRPSPQSPRQAADRSRAAPEILLCQALGRAAPCNICGVDCSQSGDCRSRGWESKRAMAWQAYAQGEYVGQERLAHVGEYRLRVDDELDLVYRLTRDEQRQPYEFNVGDEIRVESFADEALTRDLLIQPDGSITVRLLGQVRAAGRTVAQLTEDLESLYQKFYNIPAITVTPLKVNTKLEDLRASVDRRQGFGGQTRTVKVTPEGSIGLPAIGHVKAQGLSLPELQRELNERYRAEVKGIEVIPALVQRAPRYVYVLGEVGRPGRFELTGPTTVIQALAMAGSWNAGARLKQIVILRRGEDWRLLATMVDLRGALYGKQPCPAGEIWLSDSDVVIVPKSPILVAHDFIELVFTRRIYGAFPVNSSLNFARMSSL